MPRVSRNALFSKTDGWCVRSDLIYLQDLLRLPTNMNQMKVTVRQLRGRPDNGNWQPLLIQLKETGIAKFLIDVKTDNLDDFFQHVRAEHREGNEE